MCTTIRTYYSFLMTVCFPGWINPGWIGIQPGQQRGI